MAQAFDIEHLGTTKRGATKTALDGSLFTSVRDWAEQAGYGYQFMGDELFEFVLSGI